MNTIAEIDTRVCGIPCTIAVTYFKAVKGSYSYNAPSDMDYSGYTESEWMLLDRKGGKAGWLERKLTEADIARIETEIHDYMVN